MTAPASMTVTFQDLQAKISGLLFGQWGVTTPLSVGANGAFPNAGQILQINDCIKDGLNLVYSAHEWSFLRPVKSITTNAPYSAGTITIASGVVSLVSGSWPSWLATSSMLNIGGKSYAISSVLPLTIASPPADIATATACTLVPTNYYDLPAAYDSIEGPFTYPVGQGWERRQVNVIREVEIRKMMSRSIAPAPPRYAAEVTADFDPATSPGSLRQITFYPVPDASYVLSATMTLRPTMLDATNKYPLGAEVLAPVIVESVLSAAEINIDQSPGPHTEKFTAMLQLAVQRDKERSTPESLGQTECPEECDYSSGRFGQRSIQIYMNGDLLP